MAFPDTIDLVMYRPGQAPVTYSLGDERITLGRTSTCTIPIADPFLSREHAEIRRVGNEWILTDKGSVNGTFLNGNRVSASTALKIGDSIQLGDAELRVETEGSGPTTQEFTITADDNSSIASLSLSAIEAVQPTAVSGRAAERLEILNQLAMELLEDKPMAELFDFIVDRLLDLLAPSRVALAVLAADRTTFADVKVRCRDANDSTDLAISQTLLRDVVENRRALSYTDVSQSEKLARAQSIMGQNIRSALCAPLIVNDDVLGVLYMDYVITQHPITEDDVKLAAKIARIAARKLETTRLREEAAAKQKLDEELKMAFLIQSRLLPSESPVVEGFRFEGYYRPCKTVSGDYYDFVQRPDGRIYFIIADVSGKGLTAALVMAGVAAAFNTLTDYDPTPAQILSNLNRAIVRKTDASMFVTALCGVLDPESGKVRFSNAGHNRPFICGASEGAKQIEAKTGLVLGVLPDYEFTDETLELKPGSTLYLYTDGISEATNEQEDMFTEARLLDALAASEARDARGIILASLASVDEFVEGAPQADDMTLLCVQRSIDNIGSGERTQSIPLDLKDR